MGGDKGSLAELKSRNILKKWIEWMKRPKHYHER